MGCAASSNMVATEPTSSEEENQLDDAPRLETASDSIEATEMKDETDAQMKQPMAFEVPRQDDEESETLSIIQSHPPRRFRRIEEDHHNISREEVEQKYFEADTRRRQILNNRVESARLVWTRARQRALSSAATVSERELSSSII